MMKNKNERKKMHRLKGFTLIEILIVVIILGILATLSVPQFTRMISRAKMAEAWAGLGGLRTAQSIYYMEHDNYAHAVADLDCDPVTGDFTFSVVDVAGPLTFNAIATGGGDAAGLIAWMTQDGTRGCTIP